MKPHIRFAAILQPQQVGGFTVTFPDIPEAITEGDTRDEAVFNAQGVLSLALEQRMEDSEAIPNASDVVDGVWIEPSAVVQAGLLARSA